MEKFLLKWLSKKVLWWGLSFLFSGFFFFLVIFSSAFIIISSASFSSEIPETSPDDIPVFTGDFIFPLPTNTNISSHFGYRTNPVTGKNELHGGTDFPAPHGTKVVSTADGVVEFSGWNSGGFGYLIVINHGENLKSLYAHNSRLIVSKGEKVQQNTPISEVGTTGQSTGNHLHFEIHKDGKKINPMEFLEKKEEKN